MIVPELVTGLKKLRAPLLLIVPELVRETPLRPSIKKVPKLLIVPELVETPLLPPISRVPKLLRVPPELLLKSKVPIMLPVGRLLIMPPELVVIVLSSLFPRINPWFSMIPLFIILAVLGKPRTSIVTPELMVSVTPELTVQVSPDKIIWLDEIVVFVVNIIVAALAS